MSLLSLILIDTLTTKNSVSPSYGIRMNGYPLIHIRAKEGVMRSVVET